MLFQTPDFKPTGDFTLQELLHLLKTSDFIITHGYKVTHELVVDLVEKVGKGHGSGLSGVLQADFFLVHQQLEAKKKAVVNLIFPNHINQRFGLFLYLRTSHLTEPACDLFFGAFLCLPDTGLGADLQGVYLPVTVLCD